MLVHIFMTFALYTVLNIIRSYNLHEEVIKKYSLMHYLILFLRQQLLKFPEH